MSVTLVLPDPIVADLCRYARLPDESAGVLLARSHRAANGDLRLLGREMYWIPPSAYQSRSPRGMSIGSDGYVEALGLAERDGSVPIWLHTHPDGEPVPSAADKRVDEAIADVFRLRSGSEFYGTLIASPHGEGIDFTGTLQRENSDAIPIDRCWLVGDRWSLILPFDKRSVDAVAMSRFDRNVQAFGEAVQKTIGMLRIAIVGAGGTGSAVAEQLVRLGARDVALVDGDTLSESNLTRVYGSTQAQVGRMKTSVLARHLKAIAPGVRCSTAATMCTRQKVARTLAGVDLIFGCTDDNAGRLILSRLSTYYLVPVIDLGVLLSSNGEGRLSGIDGRVTILSPGNACLVCRDRIDTARAAAEMKTPMERKRLADEGYAPALGRAEPAVVTFTTMVAAAAVNELLERLIGFGHPSRPSEVLLRMHDRELSSNSAWPRPHHYCHPEQKKLGLGDTDPFLEQLWAPER